MDLWIRSQDREKLVKCNDIAIKSFLFNEIPKDEYCYSIVGYFDKETEYENLGTYKTKERALEVLDEIQELLQDETVETETTYINNIEYEKKVTITPNIPKNKIVYKMPKEKEW